MPVLRSIVIVLAVCAFAGVSSGQDVDIPRLDQRVTDFTNSLSFAEWTSLEKELKAFEDSTSNQILVLVVSSTGQTVIEEYANRVFEENRPGQEGKNNGVLIVVAIDDRSVIVHDPNWRGTERAKGAGLAIPIKLFEQAMEDCRIDRNTARQGLIIVS